MEGVTRDVIRLCHAGLDSRTLRIEALALVAPVVPCAATCFLTTDPATLLLTSAVVQAFEPQAVPAFVSNEYLEDDFIKFSHLAKLRQPVSTLDRATRGTPARSRRYREVLEPHGLSHELRMVFRSGGTAWGAMCLHRETRNQDFTAADVAFFTVIAPHLAAGLRRATLLDAAGATRAVDSPGLLLLADDLTVLSATPAARLLLDEVSEKGHWPHGDVPPLPVCTAVAQLRAQEREAEPAGGGAPSVRLRTRTGHWLTLHVSRMTRTADQISVIIEQAAPGEVAPCVLQAYALTTREQQVAALVLKGLSTEDIAARLCISALTVQQHLKAIFDKADVRSRRELVAQIFAQSYWPAMANDYGLSPESWSPA